MRCYNLPAKVNFAVKDPYFFCTVTMIAEVFTP